MPAQAPIEVSKRKDGVSNAGETFCQSIGRRRDRRSRIGDDIRAIRELLERLSLAAAQTPVSTRRGHEPPEYVGRRKAWRVAARTTPGTKSGRRWCVPRPAYAAWLALQATTATPTALPPANDAGAPWTPRSTIRRVPSEEIAP